MTAQANVTQTSEVASLPGQPSQSLKLYRAIWRWHFYAGIFAVPIIILLAITGSIYLFRPYLEPMLYTDLYYVQSEGQMLPADEQLAAVTTAFPDAQISNYSPPPASDRSATVELRENGTQMYAYVNPYTSEVLGSLVRDNMLFRQLRKLHGELLMQKFGTTIVELVGCWAIILLITGVYLWWPRPKFSVWGVFLPRLRSGQRIFWRDLHSVVGFYVAIFGVLLIMTGLPWTDVWGGAFSQIRESTGNSTPAVALASSYNSTIVEGQEPVTLQSVVEQANQAGLTGEFAIAPPKGPEGVYAVTQRPLDPAQTVHLFYDQYSGDMVGSANWNNYPALTQAVTLGIRLHQGEYFGIANLIIALLTALGMGFLAFSGTVMWWQRRPVGKLGAPKLPDNLAIPRTIAAITLVLGIFFPLVGASLIVIFLLERFVLSYIPGAKTYLGLAYTPNG